MADKKETDLKKIKELVELMIENDLVEIKIEDGDNKISLKRPQANQQQMVTQIPMTAPVAIPQVAAAAPAGEAVAPAQDDNVEIPSPMVGTFYASPSPDSDPFIKVGDRVDNDTVVCIIEAMKVMNEIKAETSGTIASIICKAGEAVEFGQALFTVKPD